jgi:molecular chaperone HtpG
MGGNMERIMKSLGQDVPDTKPILEINPKHPLVKKLKTKISQDHQHDQTVATLQYLFG